MTRTAKVVAFALFAVCSLPLAVGCRQPLTTSKVIVIRDGSVKFESTDGYLRGVNASQGRKYEWVVGGNTVRGDSVVVDNCSARGSRGQTFSRIHIVVPGSAQNAGVTLVFKNEQRRLVVVFGGRYEIRPATGPQALHHTEDPSASLKIGQVKIFTNGSDPVSSPIGRSTCVRITD